MLFFPLINIKMPTIVGILTFMSRKIFMLSLVEHKNSFITSGPGFRSPRLQSQQRFTAVDIFDRICKFFLFCCHNPPLRLESYVFEYYWE